MRPNTLAGVAAPLSCLDELIEVSATSSLTPTAVFTDRNVVEFAESVAISQGLCDNERMPEGQIVSRLGRVVRQEREARGWTSYRLAKEAGCNPALISRIESGEAVQVIPANLQRIAEALSIPSSDLMAAATERGEAEVLPGFRPYLRKKYGQLPQGAHQELERYFDDVLSRYESSDGSGPALGEDEQPD
jgi:transcriptional regulator with XRE-family HTH domain